MPDDVVHAFSNPDASRIRQQLVRWRTALVEFQARGLWRCDVTNELYRNLKAGRVTIEDRRESLEERLKIPVILLADHELHLEATTTAPTVEQRRRPDAHDIALAARHGANLWTSDRRLW